MREAILKSWKETPNTLRWDAFLSGQRWELYVPKWRAPIRRPGLIRVQIGMPQEFGLHPSYEPNADFSDVEPIKVVCKRNRHFDSPNDAQFMPLGNDHQSWQLGTAYIPFALLPHPECEQIALQIAWDWSRPWSGIVEYRDT